MVSTMEKIDFRSKYKTYYSPEASKPEILTIPDFLFVMVDGEGNPNDSPEFSAAVEALYGVSYGLKFMRKKAGLRPDYTVGPLEGLWWTKAGKPFEMGQYKDWAWTLMIMQPILFGMEEFEMAVSDARHKKPGNAKLDLVRLEAFDEGEVVQMMHIGPYSKEEANIRSLHAYAREQGYELAGKHHEIYLSDPRHVVPEKMKTIIRIGIQKPPV
jgi:hypothetical protein